MAQGTHLASAPAAKSLVNGRSKCEPTDSQKPTPDSRTAIAPGQPGDPPHWAYAAKTGIGTALGTASSVWFTLCHGILSEVYYPSLDTVSSRDLELLVADQHDFFSAEGRHTHSEASYLAPGVPAYRLVNTCGHERYRVEKEIVADPRRSVILQHTLFVPLQGAQAGYCVCVTVTSRLGNQGADNTAWVGDYKGVPMLFARREALTLALACSAPWKKRSVGFVGTSDGHTDLLQHKRMTWEYERAEGGNVALTGEIDWEACGGQFVLALAFGHDEAEAGHRARASLLQGFEAAREEYLRSWEQWKQQLLSLEGARQHSQDLYRISAMVMRAHEAKDFPGAIVASLAIPWGFAHGDDDMGYHLVWPRDLVETVGGLLAVQQHESARRVLFYLYVSQEADGHWPQNMFLNGRPYWNGIQLDETAFVILLIGLARQENALTDDDLKFLWPMARRAAEFLVCHGPVTPMDRWEEVPGYYASTMAVEISALLVAADLAETQGEPALAIYLRETADAWNDSIERLIYVSGSDLAHWAGVDGYYARLAGPDQTRAPSPAYGSINLPNHPPGRGQRLAADIISPDALALVRFGLRDPDDPRIVNTVKVIDMLCKVELPHGPCWHRYTDDGYGEHVDGAPFDGVGIGRAWPLLTGERAHYEIAADRIDEAKRLQRALESFASDSGLLPEQVWDTADLPEMELYFGRPSGSAMPLVWAHAEYVKLCRSLHEGRVFDMPPQSVQRYLKQKIRARHVCWRPDQPWRSIPTGKVLRLELPSAAQIRWSADAWRTTQDAATRDSGLGLHIIDLPTEDLPIGSLVEFDAQCDETSKRFQVRICDDSLGNGAKS